MTRHPIAYCRAWHYLSALSTALCIFVAAAYAGPTHAQGRPPTNSQAVPEADAAYQEALRLYDRTDDDQPDSYDPFKQQMSIAADKGNKDAQAIRAALNTAQDIAQLAQLLRPLADRGNVVAQTIVGSGYRVLNPTDFQLAHKYLRAAAEQEIGGAGAQLELGVMYGLGQGVTANEALGKRWITRAAANGSPKAQRVLDEINKDAAGRKENIERDNQRARDKCKDFAPSAQFVCQMMNGGMR